MRYLLIIFAMTSYLGANDLYNLDSRLQPAVTTNFFFLDQDSLPAALEIVEQEDSLVVYPARPMLYSLILPGVGQWYNNHQHGKLGYSQVLKRLLFSVGYNGEKKPKIFV